ncbi:MAG: tetraacyldisaccharide 4'-kinase [Planctomycetaceae bacterium]|nr:tetraacyldisaccharide 4'-kinase [Planctomycetaceae bacterium]
MARGTKTRPEDVLARRGGAVEALWAPALLFGLASEVRRRLYDGGLLPVARAGVPVVSLGNLSAGGTGKTPFALWLAKWFQARGHKPGLLSRGYGRKGDGPGDEARMLQARLGGAPQVEDPDRVRGAKALVAKGADVVLLDDGFQHRRLARDVDLVLVDATRPFGLPYDARGRALAAPLPRGLLRERPAALARADGIVLTRADQVDGTRRAELLARIERLAPGTPVAIARHAPVRLVGGNEARPLDTLRGCDVDLVSGIGNPEAFERTVRDLGASVREHRRFPDHHAYTEGDLVGLGEGGRWIVTTQKDAVKLADLGAAAGPVWALEVDLAIDGGLGALEALLEKVLVPRRSAP